MLAALARIFFVFCILVLFVTAQNLQQGQLSSASVAADSFSTFTVQISAADIQSGPVVLNLFTLAETSPALVVVIDRQAINGNSITTAPYRGVNGNALVPSSAVVAGLWNIGVFNLGSQTVNFQLTYLLNADHAVIINSPLSFSLAPGALHFARASAAESQFAIRSTSLIRIEAVFTTVGGDLLAQSDITNLLSIIDVECGQGFTNTGSTCEDIDECTIPAQSNACTLRNLNCTNTPGSFECTDCPAGFLRQGGACRPVESVSWYPNPDNSPLSAEIISNEFNFVRNEQTLFIMRESFTADFYYFSFFNAANVTTTVNLRLFYIDRGNIQLNIVDQVTVGSNQWTLLQDPDLDIDLIPSEWTEALLYFEFQILNPTVLATSAEIVVVPFFNQKLMPDVSEANQLDQRFVINGDWSAPQVVIGGRQIRNATFWKDVLFGIYFEHSEPITLDITVTTRLREITTSPLYRFTPFRANDYTSEPVFTFDLKSHLLEILDPSRSATVMKVMVSTAQQITDETIFVAIRRQGLPSITANDGQVTGTVAEKFFDLPVEPISGNWFIVANATSRNTGNAYDFQIRPAIYNRFDITVGEFISSQITPSYWQYYRMPHETTTAPRGLFMSLFFTNYVSGDVSVGNKEISFLVASGNAYPTLTSHLATSAVYFTDDPIGSFVPTYMGVYIPFAKLSEGLQQYTIGVAASERSDSVSHDFEMITVPVDETDVAPHEQVTHQLAANTLKYYNVQFDPVATRFTSDNSFVLHTRFMNSGSASQLSVVQKMDQFPLIPPRVDADSSIVTTNTSLSQFVIVPRTQLAGRAAHVAVRNWASTPLAYSITTGFSPLRELNLGVATSIDLDAGAEIFFTFRYAPESTAAQFQLSINSQQSQTNFGAVLSQGRLMDLSTGDFSDGNSQLTRVHTFDTIAGSNVFYVLVQNPSSARLQATMTVIGHTAVPPATSPVAVPSVVPSTRVPVSPPVTAVPTPSSAIETPPTFSSREVLGISIGVIGGAVVLGVIIFFVVRYVRRRKTFTTVGVPLGYIRLNE